MVRNHCLLGFFCLLVAACDSDDGNNGNANSNDGASDLLTGAPHCSRSEDDFRVQGTLDGVVIDDQRSTNINAGLVNIGSPTFDTPFSNLASLAASQIELHLTWKDGLFDGTKGPLTGKTLVAPANHPLAGQELCVGAGEVGFVSGGSEDGVFKFRITQVSAGADCSNAVPVDLRGCMN
ncbi:MAG TPA: hypothetical protein VIV60_06315 [Polyangiaceae bacterium]